MDANKDETIELQRHCDGFNVHVKYLVPECNKGDIHELLVVGCPLLFNNTRHQDKPVDVTTDVGNGDQA